MGSILDYNFLNQTETTDWLTYICKFSFRNYTLFVFILLKSTQSPFDYFTTENILYVIFSSTFVGDEKQKNKNVFKCFLKQIVENKNKCTYSL